MKLSANKREIKGKAVKALRREGQVPASIFGPHRESQDITVNGKELRQAYKEAGHTQIIDLAIEGETKASKVLIKDIQIDPLKDQYMHVSLYEIDPNKKIEVSIPVTITGVSPAVKNNIGFLVNPINELRVRVLPLEVPSQFDVDISKLEEIGHSIKVEDLKLPEGVEFDSSVDIQASIAFIAPPQKEIVEEEPVAAEGEETEAAEGEEKKEGAEGEAKSEGAEEGAK